MQNCSCDRIRLVTHKLAAIGCYKNNRIIFLIRIA